MILTPKIQLLAIFAQRNIECKGLGFAFQETFDNESCLPPDCIDALSEHVDPHDIVKYGKSKVKGWVMDMMRQHTDDPESLYSDLMEDDIEELMQFSELRCKTKGGVG